MTTDCLPGLICGADSTCKGAQEAFPPFEGVVCEADVAPFRTFFEVPRTGAPPADFFRLPFPNDARVSAAGALDMSDFPRPGPTVLGIDLIALYVDALVADFTGFSIMLSNGKARRTTHLPPAVSETAFIPNAFSVYSLAGTL